MSKILNVLLHVFFQTQNAPQVVFDWNSAADPLVELLTLPSSPSHLATTAFRFAILIDSPIGFG